MSALIPLSFPVHPKKGVDVCVCVCSHVCELQIAKTILVFKFADHQLQNN